MKHAQHTPGTWHAKDGQIYPEETGSTLALILPCVDPTGKEALANAALIAAAPDLLAALQSIADSEEYDGDSFVCDFATLQGVARAAIAKACLTSEN
jgi:hypothetical protein